MVTGLTWYLFNDGTVRREIIATLGAEGESQHYEDHKLVYDGFTKTSALVIDGVVDQVILVTLSKKYGDILFVTRHEGNVVGMVKGENVSVDLTPA